jgi:hypothetical protein
MRIIVHGVGATGSRAARQLVSSEHVESLLLIDNDLAAAESVAVSLGEPAATACLDGLRTETRVQRFREKCDDADVVVLTASDDHVELARAALECGAHVVSVSDEMDTVEDLRKLHDLASERHLSLVLGAGFAPGLACLLARHAANGLDVVDEIHIAKFGTGGPACARQHHRALRSDGLDWRNGQWERKRGGTGRELCWFPDPVGGLDCFQAALPEPLLLQPAFPGLVRCTSKVAATRRDMSTKWLPMLRKPHPEGMIGAVRVDVRGWSGTIRNSVIFGALDRPAVAAGAVASVAAKFAVEERFDRTGAGGLAELLADPVPALQLLADRGVRAAVFEGIESSF